ncbi:MAG: hypothetical protein A3H98_10350 [Bacteroidetes bacterium RIFCSPLOWO2_02_FULL_36_8]|nr:MAG: hypothetical protein A3H98_10350 [Bacteroidetes bacterium RIFCSPLOWO2_02_FULL_36_8]OFY70958.1 MAG: hypothetical protein A3G23_12640 [Bacteroidetes bacterium RIFCSPLOWO2_12_FULL_37_12]
MKKYILWFLNLFLISFPEFSFSQILTSSVIINPSTIRVEDTLDMTFEYTNHLTVIQPGGGVRFELPIDNVSYTREILWANTEFDSVAIGYINVSATNSASVALKKNGLFIVSATLKNSTFGTGEKLIFTYRAKAPRIAGILHIRFQEKKDSVSQWSDILSVSPVTIKPGKPYAIIAYSPMDVSLKTGFELTAVVIDNYGNKADDYVGIVNFESTDADALLPVSYTFMNQDSGRHVFKSVTYKNTGYQKVKLSGGDLKSFTHYTKVHQLTPEFFRFSGDLHFHTGTGTNNRKFEESHDGCGGDHQADYTNEYDAYKYARDIAKLDFAAAAEHDACMTGDIWKVSKKIADEFNSGSFSTFYSLEWTHQGREGHRVILFKDINAPFYSSFDTSSNTQQKLFSKLEVNNTEAIVIPHMMNQWTDHQVWTTVNNKLQPVGEIYSPVHTMKGLPRGKDKPWKFEIGIDFPWSFQYAWNKGHQIGLIAASDNHVGKPGMNNYSDFIDQSAGFAVIYSKKNSRDSLWKSLSQRYTYATTGTRILLDFSINNHRMGEEFTTTDDSIYINFSVAGTAPVSTIEIIKLQEGKYFNLNSVFLSKNKEVYNQTFLECCNNEPGTTAMYYLKITQEDNEVAWSSPIWVTFSQNARKNCCQSDSNKYSDLYHLKQNYPNPFFNETCIEYYLPDDSPVKLSVTNGNGNLVKMLINKFQRQGYYTVYWNWEDQSVNPFESGLYFYKLVTPGFSEQKKMVVIKEH